MGAITLAGGAIWVVGYLFGSGFSSGATPSTPPPPEPAPIVQPVENTSYHPFKPSEQEKHELLKQTRCYTGHLEDCGLVKRSAMHALDFIEGISSF